MSKGREPSPPRTAKPARKYSTADITTPLAGCPPRVTVIAQMPGVTLGSICHLAQDGDALMLWNGPRSAPARVPTNRLRVTTCMMQNAIYQGPVTSVRGDEITAELVLQAP